MVITPINNALIPRSVDMNLVKHQEDSKPLVDQQNIQVQINEHVEAMNHQVVHKENSGEAANDADARDEGSNKYHASGGKRKKERSDKQPVREDRVVEKKSTPSFDIRI